MDPFCGASSLCSCFPVSAPSPSRCNAGISSAGAVVAEALGVVCSSALSSSLSLGRPTSLGDAGLSLVVVPDGVVKAGMSPAVT